MNIYEKMSEISFELQTIAKNLEIKAGANSYKAVSEADVLRAVKPLEHKYKVYSLPLSREVIESGTIESIDYKGNVKKQLFERIKTVYRFINIEKPDEYVDVETFGDGIDSGDKSVGKAMTYADKYGLMKAYKIVTGDDPDQEASPELQKATAKPVINPELLKESDELGIDLGRVAAYYKKTVDALTNEDLKKCIDAKRRNLAQKEAANG